MPQIPEIPVKPSRYNASVRVCDTNGTHLFRVPGDLARRLCTAGAAFPNEGKRIWRITLTRVPSGRVGDAKAQTIHSYKTAAPVYRETMGDEDACWKSFTYAFKRVPEDLLWRLLAERLEQGVVKETVEGYRG